MIGPSCGETRGGLKGWATVGTRSTPETLRKMQTNVRAGLVSRPVVQFAQRVLRWVPARAYDQRARLLRSWLATHFVFSPDPFGVEMLPCVDYMVHEISRKGVYTGDCDDAAILSAALGSAVGFPARFVAVAFDPKGERFAHVYTVLLGPNGEEYEMDVTRTRQALGRVVTGVMTLNV